MKLFKKVLIVGFVFAAMGSTAAFGCGGQPDITAAEPKPQMDSATAQPVQATPPVRSDKGEISNPSLPTH